MTDDLQEMTMRDNKRTILDEYQKALEVIEEMQAERFDPKEIKEQEANDLALDTAETMDWNLGHVFTTIRSKIDDNLRTMQSTLEAEKEELEQVKRARAALNAELKALYGIQAQAQSFAALIEAQKERRTAFEEELRLKREQMRADFDAHKLAIQTALDESDADRVRQQNEWDYRFERECQAKTDRVNDDLQAKMKEHNTQIEAEYKQLTERKDALSKQEDELQELRDRVAGIPTEIESAVTDAKKKLTTSHVIEVNALKRNQEADTKILAHEVKTLQEANAALKAQVSALEDKLESAYEKIQGVAAQALEASGNARTTAEVQRAVQSTAPTGKR